MAQLTSIHHSLFLDTLLAASVVELPLVVIAQHLVGRGQVGELLRSIWIVFVFIGMQLLRQLSVSFFYFIRGRRLPDVQNFVKVSVGLRQITRQQ